MYIHKKRQQPNILDEYELINIRNISEKHTKVNLLGVIIQKQSVKRCTTNFSGSNSQAVLGFTLRDSTYDWINGSYWGTFSSVNSVASQFNIGDCVIVLNAKLKFKERNSYEERFMVQTPSNYHLLLRDRSGSITQYALPDKLYTSRLKSTVLSIVNCPVRYDRYRKGVVASPNSKTLIIISPDCAEANRLSQHSKHRTQSIDILESGHTSFIVENVDDRLLQSLPMGYKTAQPEIYKVPLTSIHNILTVRDLKEGKVVAGYACTFAVFTKIDLDCENSQYLVTLQCSNCHGRLRSCDPPADYDMTAPGKKLDPNVKRLFAMCTTPGCPTSGQRLSWFDKQHVNMEYGTFVHLSDHTGTYSRCLLASIAMENFWDAMSKNFYIYRWKNEFV
ncbi:unnamed protein product [Schistosoma mattheei]|uniref:MEIOB-like N-terminal domain-containing protein n=1 Tax=Schistosoma mattheei TaxID=31246 RepID=A0AA85BMM7_9TREM|nr:unnamed protein product [Schistosoma mattheei]